MQHKAIQTELAPAAIGPYSQAVVLGDFLFVSGQLPIDPKTGAFPGEDIKSQSKQSIENISAILAAAGSSMEKVLKTTVFLQDMGDFAAMNEVYATYFTGPVLPARAAIQAAALPKGANVEIEVIAAL